MLGEMVDLFMDIHPLYKKWFTSNILLRYEGNNVPHDVPKHFI